MCLLWQLCRYWIYRAYYILFNEKMPTFPLWDRHQRFHFHFSYLLRCSPTSKSVKSNEYYSPSPKCRKYVRYAQIRLWLHCISSTKCKCLVHFSISFSFASLLGERIWILHSSFSLFHSVLFPHSHNTYGWQRLASLSLTTLLRILSILDENIFFIKIILFSLY